MKGDISGKSSLSFYGGGNVMTGISRSNAQFEMDVKEQTFSVSESLGAVYGSQVFAALQYPINPGQAITFPVLSADALHWEKYRFRKLEFEFRTTINEFATNAYGRVVLSVDYDATDPPPVNLTQAENSRPVSAQVPYTNFVVGLKPSDMHDVMRWKYVRSGSVPGNADIRLYDIGNLNLCAVGNINSNQVGELWVHADGEFKNQVIESTSVPPTNYTVTSFYDNTNIVVTSGVPVTFQLAAMRANGIGVNITAGTMTLPVGNYVATYWANISTTGTITTSELQLVVGGSPVGVGVLGANGAEFFQATGLSYVSPSASAFFEITNPSTPVLLQGDVTFTGTCVGSASIIFALV